jgi:hypothetical protein
MSNGMPYIQYKLINEKLSVFYVHAHTHLFSCNSDI